MIALIERLIPSSLARWTIVAALYAFALGLAYLKGGEAERLRWEALDAQKEAAMLQAVQRAARIEDRVIYRTVDRWRTVVEKGETIVREVPTYVTVESDRRCVVPVGFARVHDAAAHNSVLPASAGPADEADSRIALSTVAETVAGNYQSCHENAEQLRALQTWVREMK